MEIQSRRGRQSSSNGKESVTRTRYATALPRPSRDAEEPQSLTTSEARLIADRAIQSAAERDVQTGVGVHVAEISDDGVDIHRYESVDDLLENR